MIVGQPPTTPTTPSVPGVPGTSSTPIYRDPNRAAKDTQDRIKRLRSWQAQNGPPPPMSPQGSGTVQTAGALPPTTLGVAPPAPRPTLPFNAANPRLY